MKEYLDLGYCFTGEMTKDGFVPDDEYGPDRIICPAADLMPESHYHLLRLTFPENKKHLEEVRTEIESYADGEMEVGSKEWITLLKKIRDIHPYFSKSVDLLYAFLDRSLMKHWLDSSEELREKGVIAITDSMKRKLAIRSYEWLTDNDALKNIGDDTIYGLIDGCIDVLRKITYFLDDTDSKLSKLSLEKRMDIYSVLYGQDFYTPVMHAGIKQSSAAWDQTARLEFDDDEMLKLIRSSDEYVEGTKKSVPQEILDLSGGGAEQTITYDAGSLMDILNTEIWLMMRDNIRVKRCRSCGRLFVISEQGDDVCDYHDRFGISCLDVERMKENKKDIREMYRSAYRTHFARVKAGNETKEAMDEWQERASLWKSQAIDGKLGKAEYKRLLLEKV